MRTRRVLRIKNCTSFFQTCFCSQEAGVALPVCCPWKWQLSAVQHCCCPQTPRETQDSQKGNQEVHLAPVRPMPKLSETQRNWQWVGQKIQGPDLDVHYWWWEQHEDKARAAQWLSEVPGPQHQGAWSAADVQQMLLCWDCSQLLLQEPQSHCGKSSPAGHQITNPNARLRSKGNE